MDSWIFSTWQFFSTNNISDINDKYEVCVSAGIWVIHPGDDGVSALNGVPNLLCFASDVEGSRLQVLDFAWESIKSASNTLSVFLLNENSYWYYLIS